MKHQELFVIKALLRNGSISRNACIRAYITRLSGIMDKLKKKGWKFTAGYEDNKAGRDYVYHLTDEPQPLGLRKDYDMSGNLLGEQLIKL